MIIIHFYIFDSAPNWRPLPKWRMDSTDQPTGEILGLPMSVVMEFRSNDVGAAVNPLVLVFQV